MILFTCPACHCFAALSWMELNRGLVSRPVAPHCLSSEKTFLLAQGVWRSHHLPWCLLLTPMPVSEGAESQTSLPQGGAGLCIYAHGRGIRLRCVYYFWDLESSVAVREWSSGVRTQPTKGPLTIYTCWIHIVPLTRAGWQFAIIFLYKKCLFDQNEDCCGKKRAHFSLDFHFLMTFFVYFQHSPFFFIFPLLFFRWAWGWEWGAEREMRCFPIKTKWNFMIIFILECFVKKKKKETFWTRKLFLLLSNTARPTAE